MKIFIAHPADPIHTGMGGAVKWSVNVANSLSDLGYSVTFFGWHSNPSNVNNCSPKFKFVPIIKGDYSFLKFIINLFRKLPFMRLDQEAVVLTHRFDIMLVFAILLPKNPKIMVSTAPLYAAKKLWPKVFPIIKIFYSLAERIILPKIDIIGVMDEVTKTYYADKDYLFNSKYRHTWTAVDTALFLPIDNNLNCSDFFKDEDKISIAYAGRLDRVKNLDFLLHSYQIVEEITSSTRLILIGDGQERLELEQLSKKLGIKNIIFTGKIPSQKMPRILNCVDLVVLTALGGEGSPTILKEALACGIPVVSLNVGDVEEFISHPLIGRVVHHPEKADFANAIIEIINDRLRFPEESKRLCCSTVTKYSINEFGVHWEHLCAEAIKIHQITN